MMRRGVLRKFLFNHLTRDRPNPSEEVFVLWECRNAFFGAHHEGHQFFLQSVGGKVLQNKEMNSIYFV
jgi:hypothetical protein